MQEEKAADGQGLGRGGERATIAISYYHKHSFCAEVPLPLVAANPPYHLISLLLCWHLLIRGRREGDWKQTGSQGNTPGSVLPGQWQWNMSWGRMCEIYIIPTLKRLRFNGDSKTDSQNMPFQKCIASNHPHCIPTSWLKPTFTECYDECLGQCAQILLNHLEI